MLNDLTAEEVIALVQLIRIAESVEGAMVFVGDTLTNIDGIPGVKSLAEKINEAGERDDVKAYLAERYGDDESTGAPTPGDS